MRRDRLPLMGGAEDLSRLDECGNQGARRQGSFASSGYAIDSDFDPPPHGWFFLTEPRLDPRCPGHRRAVARDRAGRRPDLARYAVPAFLAIFVGRGRATSRDVAAAQELEHAHPNSWGG